MHVTDNISIKKIRKGDIREYEKLFYTHYQPLVRFAEGVVFDGALAEDIVQNMFVYVWENAGQLAVHTSLRAYLFRAVYHRCLNRLKSIGIQDKNNLLYQEGLIQAGIEDVGVYPDLEWKVKAELEKLPPRMAQILQMKYMQNKKISEIADELGISENTVKTQLRRAKDKLREQFALMLVYLIIKI